MADGNGLTLQDLRRELTPIIKRLDSLEALVNDVRARTNQMYDAFAEHGLPLAARPRE